METLLARRATGFAEPATGTVRLTTNPDWRAFDRPELMHAVAERTSGLADAETDWPRESLPGLPTAGAAGLPRCRE
jgi:hypothetical protein